MLYVRCLPIGALSLEVTYTFTLTSGRQVLNRVEWTEYSRAYSIVHIQEYTLTMPMFTYISMHYK